MLVIVLAFKQLSVHTVVAHHKFPAVGTLQIPVVTALEGMGLHGAMDSALGAKVNESKLKTHQIQ